MVYKKLSDFLKNKYGEKVYKLPVNLPVTCPNRDGTLGTGGCIFCAGVGTGFESLENTLSVKEQLLKNRAYMGEKYKAKKFIAYFQNFTNTYLPIEDFRKNLEEALLPDVVEIHVSTRPDCMGEEYIDALMEIREKGVEVAVELGLQSVNEETLRIIRRGHGVDAFRDAVNRLHAKEIPVTAHLIVNLPWDSKEDVVAAAELLNELGVEGVKLHSLYIVKNTVLGDWYENGEVEMIPFDEYKERTIAFLEHLSPDVVVHRLLGRAPEEYTLFENYGHSWRKIHDEIVSEMEARGTCQGKKYKKQQRRRENERKSKSVFREKKYRN